MKMFKIPSFTTPNKSYMVIFDGNKVRCNCADFLTRGKKKKECKHIITAKQLVIPDSN